jgi:hypothetical protein
MTTHTFGSAMKAPAAALILSKKNLRPAIGGMSLLLCCILSNNFDSKISLIILG